MRVLVACEFSQVVTQAFRNKGHEAFSCDILPTEGNPDWHIQGDVLAILNDGWDMMIAHPPCTYLCSSGLHWNKRVLGRDKLTDEAIAFVKKLLSTDIKKIALENPIGCISTRIRTYDQKIQPWQFGHDASKGTCLWLKGLPKLEPIKIIPPKNYKLIKFAMDMMLCPDCGEPFCEDCRQHFADCSCFGPTQDEITYKTIDNYLFGTDIEPAPRPVWGNQTPSGQNKLGPSEFRAMERSRTYQGLANAMATQWS